MYSPTPGCSTSDMADINEPQIDDQDLNEIREFQGINVWGQHHEFLEQQALKELEIFNKDVEGGIEEGECSDTESTKDVETKLNRGSLDINLYIQRQQELKKRQVHKRSLSVSVKSKNVADEISRRQLIKNQKVLKKRKGVSASEDNNVTKKVKHEVKMNACDTNVVLEKADGGSGSEYVPSDKDSEYEPGFNEEIEINSKKKKTKRKKAALYKKVTDDGNIKCFKERLEKYYQDVENDNIETLDSIEEHIEVKPGFKISSKIWNKLYGYQQEGIEWLWELHKKCTGGLLGDEMGLGKTVQIIAFLYAINYSRVVSKYGRYTGLGPTLIVAPSTVVHQWVKHFHEWAPEFRVAVLHQSGSFEGLKTQLIKDIIKDKGILITTYQSVLKYKGVLVESDWHYLILDEGHKIRNSQAKISCAVKEFRTPHKILISGSPMQNNLQELWSLFDFINPGMLGTLTVFLEHFANPIMQGGYTNATSMQEALALSMATMLKDMITPFLLRRAKNDVKQEICLPNKSEQVLFCSLTHEQRDLYKGYLMSEQISMVLGRGGKSWFSNNYTRSNVLVGITTLRKICNHPDIYLNETDSLNEDKTEIQLEDRYGYYKKSGKMIVVSALLKIWKRQKHRVLLFTQSRSMITIFQEFLEQQGYTYLKMDGSTSIGSRQPLIEKFNTDESIEVFLLTTRVGGLGVNLTGANRVIIFDPDWNPATDTQARERAWRIGQEKQVTIYRLLSAGTIEEKMYQRQVWKQLLSNKVLLDPKTQRFFRTSDLHDLFSLQESTDTINPETANIFQNSRISLQQKINEKKSKPEPKDETKVEFSEDKLEKMRKLASQISKNISKNTETKLANKTELQIELEEERLKKLQEKENLKKMTPTELRNYNRKKLEQTDEIANKLDDCETDISFTKALVISEKSAELYNEVRSDKHKLDEVTKEYTDLTKLFSKEKPSLKIKKHKKKRDAIDMSGKVEGEKIDGLLKMEIKRGHNKSEKKVEKQDNYVLEQLFSKKGVHTALQHDVIMQSGYKGSNSIKVHSETQFKTDLALQALKKSRVRAWRY